MIKSKERDKNMEEILMLSVEIRTFDKRRIKEVMNNLKEFGKLRKMEEMEK